RRAGGGEPERAGSPGPEERLGPGEREDRLADPSATGGRGGGRGPAGTGPYHGGVAAPGGLLLCQQYLRSAANRGGWRRSRPGGRESARGAVRLGGRVAAGDEPPGLRLLGAHGLRLGSGWRGSPPLLGRPDERLHPGSAERPAAGRSALLRARRFGARGDVRPARRDDRGPRNGAG